MVKINTGKKWGKKYSYLISALASWVLFLLPCTAFNQVFPGQGGLPIPPTGTIGQTSSIASVSGVGVLDGCRRIEKVTINLLHTFTNDIALFLIAPDGTWLELSSQNGNSGNNYQITEFSDSAPANIITGSPPYNGSFKPEGRQDISLFPFYSNTNPPSTFTFENTFNGINADGDWTLFINDWIGFDVGFLNSWSITFSEYSPDLNVDLGDDIITCVGYDPVIISATPKSPLSYQYNWSSNNGTPYTSISPDTISTQVTQTTIYTVTVTSLSGGCSGTDEISVIIDPTSFPGNVNLIANPPSICMGENGLLEVITEVAGNWNISISQTNLSGTTIQHYNVIGSNGFIPVQLTENTTYTITQITDLTSGCITLPSSPTQATIQIRTLPVFSVTPEIEICEGDTLDLNQLIVSTGSNTNVSFHSEHPPGPFNEVNNPVLPVGNSQYVLLFEHDNCFLTSDVQIQIKSGGAKPIFTNSQTCVNDTIHLEPLLNPIIPGVFSGANVMGNLFTSSSAGQYQITFTPANTCIDVSIDTITVLASQLYELEDTSICITAPPFLLNALLSTGAPSGSWTGMGVTNNIFDPMGLSGSHNLIYYPDNICNLPDTTTINLSALLQPQLITSNLCINSPPLSLNLLTDPQFPIGTWSGPGVNNNVFYPDSVSPGNHPIHFVPDDPCGLPAATTIQLNTSPIAVNVITECQPGNATYTVTFTIEGGDEPSYIVNGSPTGNVFTSAPITSATDFSFTINDANNCLPQLLQGNKNCSCFTNAGTMGNTTQLSRICVNQNFSAVFNNNASLEEDTLLFVFHDNAGPTLGNVLAIQDNPVFAFPAGAQLNTTYYVSSVAGNALGNFIDPGDPCFSVAPGAPVQFYDITAAASGPNALCSNDTLRFDINVNAEFPATLYLSYQFANKTIYDTLSAFTNPYQAVLVPSVWGTTPGNVVVTVDKIKDVQCERSGLNTSLSFVLNPKRETTLQPTLCKGSQLIVNGNIYDENKPSGTEIIPSGLAGVCDSVIQVNLKYYPEARGNARPVVCQGDQIVLYGETFDVNRPTGNLVLTGLAANGCDSLLDVAIQLVQPSRSAIDTTLCAGTTATILGITFDESHVSDTITLSRANVNGCDSLVEVRVSFRDIVENTYRQQYCAGTVVTIGGINFDSNNSKDTLTIEGLAGACDTLAYIDLQFIPSPVSNYTPTICEGESVLINGNIYDQNKTSGTEVFVGVTALGCDSIVNVALTILPKSRSKVEAILCPGETITVNGVVYDENKSSGLETLAGGAVNGCDSLIEVSISFYPQKLDTLRKDLLPNDSLVVDGVVFKLGNTSGLVPYLPGSVNGCDSATFVVVRIINNNYQNVDITTLAPTCPGDQNGSLTIKAIEGCLISTLIIDGLSYGQISLPFVLDDLKPGSYEVSLSSADGCSFNQSYTVLPATQPIPFVLSPASQNVYYGEDTPLNLSINPVPETIQWEPANLLSCSDCLNPTVLQPSANTDFTLSLQDEKGCQQTAVFRLFIEEKDPDIIFPNVLYPQSGGPNAIWTIQAGDNYQILGVDIFDRWGSKVFRTGEVTEPVIWDGSFNSKMLSPGVYGYVITVMYKNGKEEKLKGDITIIR